VLRILVNTNGTVYSPVNISLKMWLSHYKYMGGEQSFSAIKGEEKAYSLLIYCKLCAFYSNASNPLVMMTAKSMVFCRLLTYIFHQSSSLAWPDHTEHAQHYSLSAKVCGSFPNA